MTAWRLSRIRTPFVEVRLKGVWRRSLVDRHTVERILFQPTAVIATACPIPFRAAFHEQTHPTIVPSLFQYGVRHSVRRADDPAEPRVWGE